MNGAVGGVISRAPPAAAPRESRPEERGKASAPAVVKCVGANGTTMKAGGTPGDGTVAMTSDEMRALESELERLIGGRSIVLMGVGNEMRGDDAFGVILAERIEDEVPVRVFVCHDLPEDYAVKAADLKPDIVIVLDAADLGGKPGDARLILAQEIPPTPGVTHRPSLEMLARFLELDAGAETWVLGVQPDLERLEVGAAMSEAIEEAVDHLAEMLTRVLTSASQRS